MRRPDISCRAFVLRDQLDCRGDARYFRPTEVDELVGDASKAAKRLGWRPTKSLKELVAEMVHSDLETSRMRPGAKTAALMSS